MKKAILSEISDTLAGLVKTPITDEQYIPLPDSLTKILITRAKLILRPEGVFVGYGVSRDTIDAEVPLEEVYPNWRKAVIRRLVDFIKELPVDEGRKEKALAIIWKELRR
jgi:hypothetical protein